MKKLFCLLLFLVPYSIYSYIMKKIPIDSSISTELPREYKSSNYFYMEIYSYFLNTSIYFCFEDDIYHYNGPEYYYCLTKNDPNLNSTLNNCIFIKLYTYKYLRSLPIYKYCYEVDTSTYNNSDRFVIVKYSGLTANYTESKLLVKSSYEKIILEEDHPLSSTSIILIVIGAIFCLIASITACVFYC